MVRKNTNTYNQELLDKFKGRFKLKKGEEYKGAKVSLTHICEEGHEFSIQPTNILSRGKCTMCNKDENSKKLRHSQEDYEEIIKVKFDGKMIVMGDYKSNTHRVKHKCTVCNTIDFYTPASLMRELSKGCKECSRRRNSKSHEDFVEELMGKWGDIKPLSKYINATTNMVFYHSICGERWEGNPSYIIKNGCKICNQKRSGRSNMFTHDDYIREIGSMYNKEIEVVGRYIGYQTKITHRHTSCGSLFERRPATMLRKKVKEKGLIGCPHCSHKKAGELRTVSHDSYVDKVNKAHRGQIDVLGVYKHSNEAIEFKHSKCGYTWFSMPRVITSGSGCPKCNNCFSKGEQRIYEWLIKNNIRNERGYLINNCRDINVLPFDIAVFIKDELVLVEYDGKQHFEPIEYFGGQDRYELQQRHDNIKTNYCKENNIKLVRIPYWDFDNIEDILERELGLVKV